MDRRAVEDVFLINFDLILSLREHHKGEYSSVDLGSAMHHIQTIVGQGGCVGLHFLEDEVNNFYVAREDSEVESSVSTVWLCVVYEVELAYYIFFEALSHYFNEQF